MPISPELMRYSVSLPPELVTELDRLARHARKHRSVLIREALELWIANETMLHAVEDAREYQHRAVKLLQGMSGELSSLAIKHSLSSALPRARAREPSTGY